MFFFNTFHVISVSEEQRSILIEERNKPRSERWTWHNLAVLLNDIGPCVKTTNKWKWVRVGLKYYLLRKLNYFKSF